MCTFFYPHVLRVRRSAVKSRDSGEFFTYAPKDIERMKRVRLHRGLRHYWGIRVRGQHTKTTGRHRAFASMDGGKKK